MDTRTYENQLLDRLSSLANLPNKCRQDLVSFAKLLEPPKDTVLMKEGEIYEVSYLDGSFHKIDTKS